MNRRLYSTITQRPKLGRCKVCSKTIHADEEHLQVFYDSSYHLVCCASCAAKFDDEPQRYIDLALEEV